VNIANTMHRSFVPSPLLWSVLALAFSAAFPRAAAGSTTYATGSLWTGTTSGPPPLVENLTTESVSGTTYEFEP
jgi:hypothetical protein